jgi:hypothetical protein
MAGGDGHSGSEARTRLAADPRAVGTSATTMRDPRSVAWKIKAPTWVSPRHEWGDHGEGRLWGGAAMGRDNNGKGWRCRGRLGRAEASTAVGIGDFRSSGREVERRGLTDSVRLGSGEEATSHPSPHLNFFLKKYGGVSALLAHPIAEKLLMVCPRTHR